MFISKKLLDIPAISNRIFTPLEESSGRSQFSYQRKDKQLWTTKGGGDLTLMGEPKLVVQVIPYVPESSTPRSFSFFTSSLAFKPSLILPTP